MPNDEYYLQIAKAVSTGAKCSRRQVGAVLVDTFGRIISTGYNGVPSGQLHCTEGGCPRGALSYTTFPAGSDYTVGLGICNGIHAEANALLYAETTRVPGSTIFIASDVNPEPCHQCWALLLGVRVAWAVWIRPESNEVNRMPLMQDSMSYPSSQ